MNRNEIKDFLEEKYLKYNCPDFIIDDPVSIPHLFTKKEDIEIAGFFSAIIAWGQRSTIIKNARKLVDLMEDEPYRFILESSKKDLECFNNFYHRTFNGIDARFFIESLKNMYKNYSGMEEVFNKGFETNNSVYSAIKYFRQFFLKQNCPLRTRKHIANVSNGSSAKRLNMFLRWMVRKDKAGVDFGIWEKIPATALMLPLDVHTGNVARKLDLLNRKQNDWKAVEEVTANLRKFDPNDPVKYDFALFGLGIYEKF